MINENANAIGTAQADQKRTGICDDCWKDRGRIYGERKARERELELLAQARAEQSRSGFGCSAALVTVPRGWADRTSAPARLDRVPDRLSGILYCPGFQHFVS